MDNEAVEKVRLHVAELRAQGLDEAEIRRRLVMASFPAEEVAALTPGAAPDSAALRPPIAAGASSEPEDLRELCMDLKEFLDKASPVLWDQHRRFQYKTLCDLRTFHYRLQEALKHGR
jgi:hypothetical protein